ncbi:MAG: class I SAM-dependent methyltransferase [Promethearchaeota archaeon]
MEENPWDQIIEGWMAFNNSGRNKHRDFLNLPAFISAMPPPEKDSVGLEIGGGEGTLARKLASLGYSIHSTDVSAKMIQEARKIESESKLGLKFSVENAQHLSFGTQSFDFVIAFMCLMNMHLRKLVRETPKNVAASPILNIGYYL